MKFQLQLNKFIPLALILFTLAGIGQIHGKNLKWDNVSQALNHSIQLENSSGNQEFMATDDDDCRIDSLPFTENFDSYPYGVLAAFPQCYGRMNNQSTISGYPYVSNASPRSGANALYFYSVSGRYNIFVLPALEMEEVDITDLRVVFWAKANHSTITFQVGVMTNPTDPSTFTICNQITFPENSIYQEYKSYLNNYQDTGRYIAIKFMSGDGSHNVQLDDLRIELAPSCVEVNDLTATNIMGSSALISWSASVSNPNGYNLEWRGAGEENWTQEYTTENYFHLPNLEGLTAYEVRVNADCGGVSDWENISFVTSCDNPVLQVGSGRETMFGYNFPIAYFNGYSQQLYMNSELGNTPMDIGTIQLQHFQASPITRQIDIYMGHTQQNTFAATSDYIPLDSLQLVFSDTVTFNNQGEDYWFSIVLDSIFQYNGESNLVFAVDDNGGATSNGTTLRFYEHGITGKTLAFYQNSATASNINPANPANPANPEGNTSRPAYRNNIRFLNCETPNCIRPNAFRAIQVSSDAIELTWIPNNSTSQYELEYRQTNASTWISEGVLIGDFYLLSGLLPNTAYTLRLRSSCSGDPDTSNWVMINARTSCENLTEVNLRFSENFDNYVANDYPHCWSKFTTGLNTSNLPRIITSEFNSSPSALEFNNSPDCANIAVLPQFDLDVATLQMDFNVKSQTNVGRLLIGVMDDPTDYSTFICIDTVRTQDHGTWQEYSVQFASYDGQGKFIAFAWVNGTNTTYFVDDIYVDLLPICYKPENLTLSNRTSTTLDISWTELGSADSYFIEIGPSGFNPGAGEEDFSFSVNTNPFTATGLTPNTSYDIYIKADCGTLGHSFWTSRQSFTTIQSPADLPYIYDFEDQDENQNWVLANGTQTNKWYIGTAANNGGTQGLYISGDNGVTNGYSISPESYVYAYRALNIDEAGEYRFSFDWRARGESVYDLLRVFLVPTDINIKAGEDNGMGGTTNTTPAGWIDIAGGVLNGSSNWKTIDTVQRMTTAGMYHLAFFWKNDGGGGMSPSAAVDNIAVQKIVCPSPVNLTISDISTTEATVNWEEFGSAVDWEIEWGLAGFAHGTGSMVQVTDTFHTIPLLTGNTLYDVYVRSICENSDSSSWITASFRTECDVIYLSDLPYTENFDDYGTGTSVLPYCWSRNYTSVNPYPYISQWSNNSPALYFNSNSGAYSMGVTEEFDMPINTLQVNFRMNCASSTAPFIIGVMTDPTDTATFEEISTITAIAANSWHDYSVYFTYYQGAGKHIAFKYTSLSALYIDDLEIALIPSCPAPSELATTAVSTTTATVEWTENGFTQTWELEYGRHGFTQGTGSVISQISGEPTYTITGLDPSSHYDFYVRSVCEDSEYSEWSLKETFSTECGIITQLPYYENFDLYGTGSSVLPYCWSRNSTTTSSNPHINAIYFSAPGSLYFYAPSGTSSIGITGEFGDALNTLQVKFKVYCTSTTAPFTIGAMTDPSDTATFVAIRTITVPVSGWNECTVYLSSYQGTGQYIAFKYASAVGLYMDNLEVSAMPLCPDPSDLRHSAVGATTATLEWTESGSAQSWELEYGISGFTQGTGTTMPQITGTPTCSLSGLVANINYDFYVRAVCGDNEYSPWSPKGTFRTSCNTITLIPHTENFDDTPGGSDASISIPTCWTALSNATKRPYVSDQGIEGCVSTPHCLYFNWPGANVYALAALPEIDPSIPVNTLKVSFWGKVGNAGRAGIFTVGVMSDPLDRSTFIPVDTITKTETMTLYTVNFANYAGNGKNIAFIWDGGVDNGYYIDDVEIDYSTTCRPPTNITVSNITGISAKVNWIAGSNETEWIVGYKKSSDQDYSIDSVTTNSKNLLNLTPETLYEVYVKAKCGDEYSDSVHTTFTTLQHTVTYTIQASAIGNGTISPNGNVTVTEGATQIFELRPDSAYKVGSVTVDEVIVDESLYADNKYTFANVHADATIQVTFVEDVGVVGYDLGNSVSIFPNPTNNILNVKMETPFETVEISNMIGQVIHRATINDQTFSINVSHFNAGVYFIKLTGESGNAVKKFVVKK